MNLIHLLVTLKEHDLLADFTDELRTELASRAEDMSPEDMEELFTLIETESGARQMFRLLYRTETPRREIAEIADELLVDIENE